MKSFKVFTILLMIFLTSRASETTTQSPPRPARICVPPKLMIACDQMAHDLPESFTCVAGRDVVDCTRKVQQGEADILNVDPHAMYVGGKYFGLVPLAEELVDGAPYRYQGIALVSSTSNISSLSDLQGRKSCHTRLGGNAGWKIPIGILLSRNITKPDCRGELYAIEAFFGGSCAAGKWSNDPLIDKEMKNRHRNLCSQCQDPSSCSVDDAYNGYEGAIKCLLEEAGEVAFTKVPALKEYLEKDPTASQKMELLCLDGTKKPVTSDDPCIWAYRPSNAFMTSAALPDEEHERLLSILLNTQARYPPAHVRKPDWYYKSFHSSDKASGLQAVPPGRRTYDSYMGEYIHTIEKPDDGCDHVPIRFCVTSEEEKQKCEDYVRAAKGRAVTWPLDCVLTASKAACMEALKEDNADIVTLDGGDVYKGGRYYDLQPISAEVYDGSDATYYAVAVVRSASDVEKLSELRGLRSCHTGIGRTAGWVVPTGALIDAGLIPANQCNRAEGVADFFGSSCAPGANDTKYNPGRTRADDLCKRCIGDESGEHKCARDSRERYSGYAGALRCLADGAGDVAFIKHTTVPQYTDGKGNLPWTKDLLSSDFQLLCRGGGRSPVSDYVNCNLAKVPSHYVMTGASKNEEYRFDITLVLAESAKYFGDDSTFFKLFDSYEGHPDLLFKDATTTLKTAPLSATYQDVLGTEFYKASEAADPKICH